MNTKFISSITLALLLSNSAYAADKDPCDDNVFSSDGDLCVTITAHRTPQALKNVGASTTIITRQQMERRGIRNVTDALKRVPGASLARTGGFGSTSNIRLRGSDSGQVRVLIDGVTVNDPTNTENFFDFSTIQTNDIERIEVIRGPQSALWGADTTGGVINIITRKNVTSSQTSGFAEVGSYQTYRAGLSHYNTVGKVSYGGSVQHYDTQGFSRIAASDVEDDGTVSTDAKGNLGIQILDNLSFDAAGGWSNDIADFDPNSTTDGPAKQDKLQYYGSGKLTLANLDGKLQQTVKVSHFSVIRDSEDPSIAAFNSNSEFQGRRNQATYQADLALRERDTATIGLDWQRDGASTQNTQAGVRLAGVNADINNKAVFGQYIVGITDDWTASIGGRHDDHSSFGAHNTYRATTAYNIPSTGTTLRGTYGTGFKAPSLFQLFAATFGNPNLQPEESRAFDVGIEQRLVDGRLVLGTTAFRSKVKNLVTFTTGFENVNRAEIEGLESTATFAISPTVLLSANHTWLNAEAVATGRDLPRRPKHTAAVALDIDTSDDSRIAAEVLHVSNQRDSNFSNTNVKSHTTVNLNGSVDVNRNYTIYADLENIFNKDYQEIVGFQAPGFAAYIGVRAKY